MKFNMSKEWLVSKLAEMDAEGIEEVTVIGGIDVPILSGPTVRAKMRCNSITKSGSEKFPNMNIQLGAVFSQDPDSENKAFASATPSASVNLNIDSGRPAAHAFNLEQEYYVDFTPVPMGVRYLRDGVAPVEVDIMLTKRDASGAVKAHFTPPGTVATIIDGVEISESAWCCDKLTALGYTHWRYPEAGE